MAFKPTKMQEKAIETRGNILVSAAAGSGKTAVLVERVIDIITDKDAPVDVDKLLIVTFTNAAAAEMRSRIEKRIHEVIQETDNADTLQRLQEQKYLLQKADICTIDSFCINLVRKNFEKCGVQPDFTVCDLSQQVDTCNNVMSGVIAEYLENPTKDFIHLLELANCEYDEKELADLVKNLYDYSQLLPFPENFIKQLLLPYETKFNVGNTWYDMAFELAQKCLQTSKKHAQKMLDVASYVEKKVDEHIDYAEKIFKTIDELENAADKKDWDRLSNIVKSVSFSGFPSGSTSDQSHVKYKVDRDIIKKNNDDLKEIFYTNRQEIQDEIDNDYGSVKLLTEMVTKYGERLFEAFCQKNEFTFSDMEQMAFKLLCEYKSGKIEIRDEAKSLCEYYDEVLVDEFQDVNDLQDALFNVLSNNEEKLFVVGDVKQSIYGFRGSNPENFLDKKNRYIPIDKAKKGEAQKIILSDNFRSRPGVCDSVNFFFSQLLAGQCSSIIYDADEYLNAGGKFAENNVSATDVLLLDKSDDDSEDKRLEIESRRIAEYILSVMNEGKIISDKEKIRDENGNVIDEKPVLRDARYGDFAILLDKMRGNSNIIAEALCSYDIPVALGGDAFMESREVSTVMSLLQVIDNPKRDVQLLDVMMSPIFAFTAEEMAKIRAGFKYGSLYSAVIAYSKTGDKKTLDFIEKLADLRRDAAVLSIDRLVSKIIHSTDILNIMSALDSGKIRRANLFALIKYAKGFEARFSSGIYGFIRYMNSLPENSFKGVNTSGENAVKIMSMHGSKGLQFPVCIVANLTGEINKRDYVSRTLFNEKCGISFKYYSETQKQDKEMIGHIVSSDSARAKTVGEKLRLLYVAMTRAIDRLCLVCSDNTLDKTLHNLAEKLDDDKPYISREFLQKSNTMASWVLSCALIHPDGKVLRQRADVDLPIVKNNSKLNIIISDNETFNATLPPKGTADDALVNAEFVRQIKENACWTYPYEQLRYLQAKASVSRLVHSAEDDRYVFESKPAFLLGDKLAGAARGSAMHHVMQFINFEKTVDVEAEIERLREWKFISEQEANSVDIAAISTFFDSDVYKRIMMSGDVRREMRFLSEIPANQIDDAVSITANIIVQGAVDLCFDEDDGIVVLDFKTDRVKDMSELVKTYGEQLDIYSMAAKKIWGKHVKEKIIYSFHLGKSISF